MHGVNLGTLLRTCEATGACLAVPHYPWVPQALSKGYTIAQRGCVHWVRPNALGWLAAQKFRECKNCKGSSVTESRAIECISCAGTGYQPTQVIGVELADEAVKLADMPPARQRTVMVLGHEQKGIPPEALDLLDLAVEIPMIGSGTTLNVAVAGSLVLYKLAGLI